MTTERADPGPTTFTGRHVIGDRGDQIGTVTDVIYDDSRAAGSASPSTPTWMVVDPGPLRAPHYVPVAGSYTTQQGDIVVPWDRQWVKSAPKARGNHVLSDADRRDLTLHYQSTR